MNEKEPAGKDYFEQWRPMLFLGAAAALIQVVLVVLTIVLMPMMNLEETIEAGSTTEAMLVTISEGRIWDVITMDVISLGLIVTYLFTTFAAYPILRKVNKPLLIFSLICIFMAITICISTNSSMQMVDLGRQYATADDATKERVVAAGEAVRANDMWHGTSSLFAGILLQGGAVIFSFIMLRSKYFMRVTAGAGILANGLDLFQHLMHYSFPQLAAIILAISGVFYLIWFPALGWDLWKNYGGRPSAHSPA